MLLQRQRNLTIELEKSRKSNKGGINPIVIKFDHLKEQILLSWSILFENPEISLKYGKCCILDGILVRKLK